MNLKKFLFKSHYNFQYLLYKCGIFETIEISDVSLYVETFAKSNGTYFQIESTDVLSRRRSLKNSLKFNSKHIRPAGIKDAKTFCEICNYSYTKLYGNTRINETEFIEKLKDEFPCVAVDTNDGTIIGTFSFSFHSNGSLDLECFAIHPKYQGKSWMKVITNELAATLFDPRFKKKIAYCVSWESIPGMCDIFVRIMQKEGYLACKIPKIIIDDHPLAKNYIFQVGAWFSLKKEKNQAIKAREKEKEMSGILDTVLSGFGLHSQSTKCSLVSLIIGCLMMLSIFSIRSGNDSMLGLFMLCRLLWHMCEFIFHDIYHHKEAGVDSFCLDSKQLILTTAISILEHQIWKFFFPFLSSHLFICILRWFGVTINISMQFFQVLSKVTMGKRFSYYVANAKEKQEKAHQLCKRGVYSKFRHPRYFGFFYASLALCFILLNPVSFFLQLFALVKFYGERIKKEETELLKVYGEEYEKYKIQAKIYIPFLNSM